MFVNVDEEMATIIAESVGVNPPKGSNVAVTKSSPALSEANTPHYAYTQKVAVLIGDGFDGQELKRTLQYLNKYGVYIAVVSAHLGTVTGRDGTEIEVDTIFTSTYPVLYDSIYVVGGRSNNQN